jgi:hypothetical protein
VTVSDTPEQEHPDGGMFAIEITEDATGRVIVIGRSSRKRVATAINIPISGELRERLESQIVGSLSMGTSALLEWALTELQRQGISIHIMARE